MTLTFNITNASQITSAFQKKIAQLENKTSIKISSQFYQDLLTAFTEGVANAIRHAKEIEQKGKVEVSLKVSAKKIEIRIWDHGPGFKMDQVPQPQFDRLSESGRGVFMMRQLMDAVEYKKLKSKNVLVLQRYLIGSDSKSRDLDLLYEISNAILQTVNVNEVYHIILDKMIQTFHVERASILMFDKALNRLKVVASRGLQSKLKKNIQIRPGQGISGYVFRHSKPCLITDMQENQAGWKSKKKYKSRSFMSAPMICSPLKIGQETVGVINMTDRIDGKAFSKKDLRLLTTIANQAAAYLHICRLLEESKKAQQMQADMELARQIQQSFLPQNFPKLKGVDLAGWLETAESVGGDYYDFILKNNQELLVVIADVSGHNLAAAMTMVSFRSQLRALALSQKDPGKILTLLNKSLFADLEKHDQFVSAVLVHLNFKQKQARLASAGHHFPLIFKNNKLKQDLSFKKAGAVMGALEDEAYKSQTLKWTKGEWMILYTDGVTEAISLKQKRLGVKGLYAMAQKHRHRDARSLIDGIQKEVRRYRGSLPVHDDNTVVALHFV